MRLSCGLTGMGLFSRTEYRIHQNRLPGVNFREAASHQITGHVEISDRHDQEEPPRTRQGSVADAPFQQVKFSAQCQVPEGKTPLRAKQANQDESNHG